MVLKCCAFLLHCLISHPNVCQSLEECQEKYPVPWWENWNKMASLFCKHDDCPSLHLWFWMYCFIEGKYLGHVLNGLYCEVLGSDSEQRPPARYYIAHLGPRRLWPVLMVCLTAWELWLALYLHDYKGSQQYFPVGCKNENTQNRCPYIFPQRA